MWAKLVAAGASRLYGRSGSFTTDRFLRAAIVRAEGGEPFSPTLRRVFAEEYGVEIGMYTYGGCFEPHQFDPGTTIGRYCSLARTASAWSANHPLDHRSTHAFFYNTAFGVIDDETITRTRLTIGNDVWLGHGATILPSVSTIGDGAVIGAATLVTDDVPPFAVVVGNPGRILRYRFDADTIAALLEERWWEQPLEVVRLHLEDFVAPLGAPHPSSIHDRVSRHRPPVRTPTSDLSPRPATRPRAATSR